jgi:transposase
MLNLSNRRIFLASKPIDMRKSFDSLAAVVNGQFGCDPLSGDAFLFIGKRKNRLKILIWEDSGFWLHCKRLEIGTFHVPDAGMESKIFLSVAEFHLLLAGIIVKDAKHLKRYHPHKIAAQIS